MDDSVKGEPTEDELDLLLFKELNTELQLIVQSQRCCSG